MVKGNSTLNIRMVIGGLKDDRVINTYYLYTNYNTPIPLTGGMDGSELILREAEDMYFVFPHFDPGFKSVTGSWIGETGTYAVTLTRE
ncbi:MAG: hypothetical protein LBD37_10460 [Treponema sp.]|jgi:hypothetical protein|nr:hypothetical protein [Treponema sp.]